MHANIFGTILIEIRKVSTGEWISIYIRDSP